MPSGEIWGGNGPAAGALIGLTQGPNRAVFFASLAVVGTYWGDQPPSGVVGGGPRVTRRRPRRRGAGLCPWPVRGGRFLGRRGGGRGYLRDRWLRSWARKK
jgi:hypothetical protein